MSKTGVGLALVALMASTRKAAWAGMFRAESRPPPAKQRYLVLVGQIVLQLELGANMGDAIRFIPKSERERVRLIREARAIYDSIFPPADLISEQRNEASVSAIIASPIPVLATR